MISLRPVEYSDFDALADILNPLIDDGSSTAISSNVTGRLLADWRAKGGENAHWTVAVENGLRCVGFQWIQAKADLPKDVADIATFIQMGEAKRGIGGLLFKQTLGAAKALGYKAINANIRADNVSGLGYYAKLGFEDHAYIKDMELNDGRIVDKVIKRYAL